jgi:hypothetical protein
MSGYQSGGDSGYGNSGYGGGYPGRQDYAAPQPGTNRRHSRGRRAGGWAVNAGARTIFGKLLWMKVGGTVLALVAGLGIFAKVNHLAIFKPQTTITSSGVLLSLHKIADFHAATGNYRVMVEIKQHHEFLPSWLVGRSIEYVGFGTDDAIVNFGALSGSDVQLSDGNTAVSIVLPVPQVGPASLNLTKSYAASASTGIGSRLANVFKSNPGLEHQAEVNAVRQIHQDAEQGNLIAQGETSTANFLTKFIEKLGLKQVSVSFN